MIDTRPSYVELTKQIADGSLRQLANSQLGTFRTWDTVRRVLVDVDFEGNVGDNIGDAVDVEVIWLT